MMLIGVLEKEKRNRKESITEEIIQKNFPELKDMNFQIEREHSSPVKKDTQLGMLL